MQNLVIQIVVLALSSVVAVNQAGSFSVVGILAAVSLIGISASNTAKLRIAAQCVFYAACVFVPACMPCLPVGAACSMRERSWAARFLWLIPLVIYGLDVFSPNFILISSFVNPLYGDALSGPALMADFLWAAVLCFAAAVLTINDSYNQSLFNGLRFAYDELRERYLSLRNNTSSGESLQALKDASETLENIAQKNKFDKLPAADNLFSDLTERELAVARLVAEGKDNREIAAELYLSQGTVRNHISNILMKKELTNRTQLAVLFLKGQQGL